MAQKAGAGPPAGWVGGDVATVGWAGPQRRRQGGQWRREGKGGGRGQAGLLWACRQALRRRGNPSASGVAGGHEGRPTADSRQSVRAHVRACARASVRACACMRACWHWGRRGCVATGRGRQIRSAGSPCVAGGWVSGACGAGGHVGVQGRAAGACAIVMGVGWREGLCSCCAWREGARARAPVGGQRSATCTQHAHALSCGPAVFAMPAV